MMFISGADRVQTELGLKGSVRICVEKSMGLRQVFPYLQFIEATDKMWNQPKSPLADSQTRKCGAHVY